MLDDETVCFSVDENHASLRLSSVRRIPTLELLIPKRTFACVESMSVTEMPDGQDQLPAKKRSVMSLDKCLGVGITYNIRPERSRSAGLQVTRPSSALLSAQDEITEEPT